MPTAYSMGVGPRSSSVVIEVAEMAGGQLTLSLVDSATRKRSTHKVAAATPIGSVFELWRQKDGKKRASVTFFNGQGAILHPDLTASMLKGGGSTQESAIVKLTSASSQTTVAIQVVKGIPVGDVTESYLKTRDVARPRVFFVEAGSRKAMANTTRVEVRAAAPSAPTTEPPAGLFGLLNVGCFCSEESEPASR